MYQIAFHNVKESLSERGVIAFSYNSDLPVNSCVGRLAGQLEGISRI